MMCDMKKLLYGIAIAAVCLACSQEKPVLKDVFKEHFYIGTAMNRAQIFGKDSIVNPIIKEHFNTITGENCMKWDSIHPQLNTYTFELADSFVAYGQRNNMYMIGHCLVWHSQVPNWLFEDSLGKAVSRDTLLKRLHDHILTVVGRYKGKVQAWDVVNEALNEDGTLRQSKWMQIIGEDYIAKAFEFAKEADPNAKLYYNDYNIEQPAKREGALKLLKNLQAKGIKVDGVGIQGHYHLDMPSLEDIDKSIVEYAKLGMEVMFTELDINVLPRPENLSGADISQNFELTKESNPFPVSLPDSMQEKLANRYADMFKIFMKHKSVSRVTFWGTTDNMSWLNGWPIQGRTNYPLIFDRQGKPKKAFNAIVAIAKENSNNSN